ncbi:MAG: TRAP transporter small permease subunit [Firmicutes bacterium]|nr:TRAP transporter small permease subunit [Bacillota bacterium]
MRNILKPIDLISEKFSKYFSFFVLIMMALVIISVMARYFLKVSFIWAVPINRQMLGIFTLLAGSYTMLLNKHVSIDILYNHFPSKLQFFSKLLNFLGFIIVVGVIVWQSGRVAISSVMMQELSSVPPKVPLYIIKSAIPLLCFFFLFQGISSHLRKLREKS